MLYHLDFADYIITVFVHLQEGVKCHCISSFDLQIFFQVLLDIWFHLFITYVSSVVSIEFLKPLIDDSLNLLTFVWNSFVSLCRNYGLRSRLLYGLFRFRLGYCTDNCLLGLFFWALGFTWRLLLDFGRLQTSYGFDAVKHLELIDGATCVGVNVNEGCINVALILLLALRG